jgi:hypothetical protein
MTRSPMSATLALALSLALILAPVAAFGAAATTATPSPTAAAGGGGPASTIEVQIWPSEADGSSVIVSAEIPADVKLPYTLRLPMPAGLNITWCGEIMGGGAADDKEVTYTVEEGRGGKALVMTLSKSRIGQFEGTLSSPVQAGGRTEATMEWIQSAPAGEEHFAVKLANTAGDPKIEPAPEGAPQQNETGERLYSLATQKLSIGQTLKIGVSWTTVAAGSQTSPVSTSGSGSYDVVLIALSVALAVALVALIVVLTKANKASEGSEDSDATSAAPPRRPADAAAAHGDESGEEKPLSDDPFGDLD